jgi:ribonucleoside-diphosphate reductase alpha chain
MKTENLPSTKEGQGLGRGLVFKRFFTKPDAHPLDEIKYVKRSSVITNPDGSVVFKMENVEVPESWSQLATDIIVSKYFRKAGVPETGSEVSARQVVRRIAHSIRAAGEKFGGYFKTAGDAQVFEEEMLHLLIQQKCAFNSPVWFNCGMDLYGIKGSGGNFYWDPATDTIRQSVDSYSNPQCSACFIQSVDDSLMSIFDLIKNEARLFKYGSGTGTNFSKLRGRQEKLSSGGTSSGLMSFLEVLDRGAGATKSGGTTRRAAKMVCLDLDHPEIMDFITWKVREEKKVAALIAAGYSSDFNGEAYKTVGGQNSNNSVRISDEFMRAYLNDGKWQTRFRTTGDVCETFQAKDMMDHIAFAAWACADPSLIPRSTIGILAPTPIASMHPIHARNTCSWMIRRVTCPR